MRWRASIGVGLLLGVLGSGTSMVAQEGSWSLSASAGIGLPQFDAVDEDGRRDIAAYNTLGVPIGSYPELRTAPVAELAAEYRFERDMAVAPFVSYQLARTQVAFRDSARYLSLDRRLTSILVGFDLLYYFPRIVGGSEVSLSAGLANLWASADQTTRETETVKSGPLTEERDVQDAYALYKKSKLVVRVGGRAVVPFAARVSFTLAAQYLYAPMGSLSGTLREFDLVRPHDTTIEFNYSAARFLLGCQIIIL